ncbi:hypothetical protein [Candidatus Dormiibacter inghamiae]|uniref:hypothetical protein n=1 Tax=Candidatus Dormiibacter inghamiae TaxID=3127013 RepID=UPI0030C6EFFD
MQPPVVGLRMTDGRGDSHLGHHRRAAPANQALVEQEHVGIMPGGFDRGVHSRSAAVDVRYDPSVVPDPSRQDQS